MKNDKEDEIIQNRREKREDSETEEGEVNPHRIEKRVEVGRGVAVQVNRSNRFLRDAAALMLAGHQRVKFELVSGSGNSQQVGKQGTRDRTQAGLGV
jgi:hypothetical protein